MNSDRLQYIGVKEDVICKQFANLVRGYESAGKINHPFYKWTHVDNGQRGGNYKQRIIAGRTAKEMGVHKGWLDYTFVWIPEDIKFTELAFLEFKVPHNKVKEESMKSVFRSQPEQLSFLTECDAVGIYSSVCFTPNEGINKLIEWGFINGG